MVETDAGHCPAFAFPDAAAVAKLRALSRKSSFGHACEASRRAFSARLFPTLGSSRAPARVVPWMIGRVPRACGAFERKALKTSHLATALCCARVASSGIDAR
ncbi:hypothetical protein [Luteimonas padinae]|uniref:hypothetical protein n=1 Tax=Luteimonas padinae TaxID=1714359 RepID=UPI00167976E4|nr:hypothetical protein [Luteimonas padinae]